VRNRAEAVVKATLSDLDEIGALIWSVISSGVPVMGNQVVVLDDQNRTLRTSLGEWWPDRYGERFAGLEARCNALRVEDEELDVRVRDALDRSSVDFPVDVARTQLAYGRRLLQAGRHQDSDQQLERAPAVAPGLTPTEREIVGLVLQRRTNAEIARALSCPSAPSSSTSRASSVRSGSPGSRS